MHTDFSGAVWGAVLAQEGDEGREYVVEFVSRICQGAEPKYASYEGECLAMLYRMDKFTYYLFGMQFVAGGVNDVNADCLSREPVEGDSTELDGRGKRSPKGTVRHGAAFCCAAAESSRQPELSAWARRRVLDAAREGAANGDLVMDTGELSAGPRRGDPWMDAEAMAELQAMPQPYARYTWRDNIL
eukprot:jgi/Tetstr1/441709/TSEL_029932.t1